VEPPAQQGLLGGVPVLPHEYSNLTAVPDEVDWRASGAVTDVKSQGQCGACWAFATTGALEGAWKIGTGTLIDFSEQQLVDCTGEYGMRGCGGGNVETAIQYGASQPICNEMSYQYTASQGQCRSRSCTVAIPIGGIKQYRQVPRESEQALLTAVAQQPVAVSIEADKFVFQVYQKGIIKGMTCGTSGVDHAVLVVGYGSDGGEPYWIIKNSWGSQWGEGGYARIARGGDAGPFGVCLILSDPVYAVIDSSRAEPPNVTASLVLGVLFVSAIALACCVGHFYKGRRNSSGAVVYYSNSLRELGV